ncbi:unnamed protein product [Arabis nemorensis]|uniref:Kinesin-like protein n=1 Tax=Arabis nemorensis TaxID=586526 RepID=A0A565ATJ0_9BRAS|nr:unnamed protein product [Arabis nemorensis]
MEELQKSFSPPPCPTTVTVRRNPPRKARATPYTTGAKPHSVSSTNTHNVPSFPIDEILSIQIPQSEPLKSSVLESLKIFLRIKPLKTLTKVTTTKSRPRNVWPQNPSKMYRNSDKGKKSTKIEEACIALNDSYSVTLTPPQALQELKRSKTEVYEGFSHVFPADCSQNDVYGKMVQPLLEDFMKGKSGMLAALGPSGSGKTHTVFGTPKDPGIVPLTLRQIFKKSDESSPGSLRSFYLSIFEICSERGKGEKAYDLLGDGSSELSVQQSTIRGLKEVPIHNLEEAESLIGQAMLKRATATTNSNSQSSRSQCIINIRAASNDVTNETKMQSSDAMLTIVDLAGAEREKRTGNQGERLVESNFINNTSMVFGQCLRILTVKAGEEDYLDTSYLLKQASPYMKIKFDNTEEPCNKRQLKTFLRVEKNKKIKLSAPKTSQIEESVAAERNRNSQEVNLQGKKADPTDKSSPKLEHDSLDKIEREHIIMRNFAKVLWNVLKQYNEKLKVAEGEICSLKDNLRSEQLKSLGLETELIHLKSSCKQNLAEPCIPKIEALTHAKEQFERNVDDDPCNLIKTRGEASVEECNKSPVPCKNVKDAEFVLCHTSTDNDVEPRQHQQPANSEENVGTTQVEAEAADFPSDQAIQNQDDPTPSPERVEASQDCINNQLSKVQTESAISRRFSDSEKQKRNRRLLPASSRSVPEEMNDLDINDNQIEKPQVKISEAHVQEKSKSTQGPEIEVHAREAAKKQGSRQKPRRRLQPASSVLLTREINTLEIEDDVAEPKGNRGRKKTTVPQPRSQGSVTLLRLLTNNLHI